MIKSFFTLVIIFQVVCQLAFSQEVLYTKSHKIDSIDWLYFKDFQNINAGTIIFGDYESKSKSAKDANKYQFGAFRFDLEGELKQYKLIPDITHNFFSSIVSMGSEYLALTNQPYQYFLTEGFSNYKIGSFRMNNLLDILDTKRYPDSKYLPAMFYSPSFDRARFFYGDLDQIYGIYSGYKTNLVHKITSDLKTGNVTDKIFADLSFKKNEIIKDYIPSRFWNDVFWMETGAIESNGSVFLLGYFVSFKSDSEYQAYPLNLIIKLNQSGEIEKYKILDYSAVTFNFFRMDRDGFFYSSRGNQEILKFNSDLDFVIKEKLNIESQNSNIFYVYFYQNALFWVGSSSISGGIKPLIVKTDLNGNKIWEILLQGNISYGTPPLIIQKTPSLYLAFSGQGNNISVSEILDNSVGIQDLNTSIISLSPNPASDFLEINIQDIQELPLPDIFIYNMQGECLIKEKHANLPVQRVDISTLCSGMYFLRIGNSKPIKFMKL